jgi:hypothetical protein
MRQPLVITDDDADAAAMAGSGGEQRAFQPGVA